MKSDRISSIVYDSNRRAICLEEHYMNMILYMNDQKIIEDDTLVAITLMIAESRTEEKETMIRLVMNFIT